MQIISKKIKLTSAMKEHIEQLDNHLNEHANNLIISSKIIISEEGKGIKTEINLSLKKRKSIIVSKVSTDFYKAVSETFSLAEKSLRNLHEKASAIHRDKLYPIEDEIEEDAS